MTNITIASDERLPLWVLLRMISPYSGSAIVLGVFTTPGLATKAGNTFTQRHLGKDHDEHREQAYHSVSSADVQVQAMDIDCPNSLPPTEVYVLSEYSECMGQVVRQIVHLSPRESIAKQWAEVPWEEMQRKGAWVSGRAIERVPLDTLRAKEGVTPHNWY